EISASLRVEGHESSIEEDLRRVVDCVTLGDSAKPDANVRFVEEDGARRRVEVHVPEADLTHERMDRGRGGGMGVEILVELPESVKGLERDVERAIADRARMEPLADDVERLRTHDDRSLSCGRVDPRDLALGVPGRHQLLEADDLGGRRVEEGADLG